MTKKTLAKLSLSKQTFRKLGDGRLARVEGASGATCVNIERLPTLVDCGFDSQNCPI